MKLGATQWPRTSYSWIRNPATCYIMLLTRSSYICTPFFCFQILLRFGNEHKGCLFRELDSENGKKISIQLSSVPGFEIYFFEFETYLSISALSSGLHKMPAALDLPFYFRFRYSKRSPYLLRRVIIF